MANYRDPKQTERLKRKVLSAATKKFLTKGYAATTVKEIAAEAGISTSSLMYIFKSKEEILSKLVSFVLEGQFGYTEKLLQDKAEDRILFYAAETTLQLHIVETSEHIRELYNAAYSLPRSTEIIQQTITLKLENIFREHLPHLETKDFYELEVASGGIMRAFMSIPCDMYFTMDRKVKRFLETTFLIYRVPDEKINEAVEFVSGFDFRSIAQELIGSMIEAIEKEQIQIY